jgi:histidine triad (HIT) family protein
MPAACAFCEIARRTVAAPVVFEDERLMAFLDRRPLFEGHTLLIPKSHVETLTDLASGEVGPLFRAARLLAGAMEDALGAEGTFLAVNNRVSQSVAHLHVHIVPRRRKDGLRGFFWPRTRYPDDAAAERVRALLAAAVDRLGMPQDGAALL